MAMDFEWNDGFLLVAVIILPLGGIWGHIEGPVEPLTLVMAGSIFTFALQWRFLKKEGYILSGR